MISTLKTKAIMPVQIGGCSVEMKKVWEIAKEYNLIVVEDASQALFSKYLGKYAGTQSEVGCFSMSVAKLVSSGQGGFAVTKNRELYEQMKLIRTHGVANVNAATPFTQMGFNFRSTDLQAFLGIHQLEKAQFVIETRNKNYQLYHSLIKSPFWSAPLSSEERYISNFAYPMISDKRTEITNKLIEAGVQTRPLICGSIGRQPFWVKNFGLCPKKNADKVHDHGFYLPNNCEITEEEIKFICSLVEDTQ